MPSSLPMRLLLLLCLVVACVHPQRSTSLSPVQNLDDIQAPNDLHRLSFVSAIIPPRARGDQPWDEDGSPPDPFVRVYRDGDLIYESDAVDDSIQPRFEDAISENVILPRTAEVRIELWDSEDLRLPKPIGTWRGRGLPPTALPGADARITMEGSSQLTFRVEPPEAFRGTGITLYELRRDELFVDQVIRFSPAGRAGLDHGDRIIAIDGQPIADLGNDAAAGALSMASSRRTPMTVIHADGRREDVTLDSGYVWRSR